MNNGQFQVNYAKQTRQLTNRKTKNTKEMSDVENNEFFFSSLFSAGVHEGKKYGIKMRIASVQPQPVSRCKLELFLSAFPRFINFTTHRLLYFPRYMFQMKTFALT